MAPSQQQVTQLLVAWGGGDQAALDELMPLVHEELRRLARRCMNRERPGQYPADLGAGQRGLPTARGSEERSLAGPHTLLRHRRAIDAADPGRLRP